MLDPDSDCDNSDVRGGLRYSTFGYYLKRVISYLGSYVSSSKVGQRRLPCVTDNLCALYAGSQPLSMIHQRTLLMIHPGTKPLLTIRSDGCRYERHPGTLSSFPTTNSEISNNLGLLPTSLAGRRLSADMIPSLPILFSTRDQ